jgi:hypothetical protein
LASVTPEDVAAGRVPFERLCAWEVEIESEGAGSGTGADAGAGAGAGAGVSASASTFDHPWQSLAAATRFELSRAARLPARAAKALVDGVRALAADASGPAGAFLGPVDLAAVAGYGSEVALPVCLATLLRRAVCGHYRRVAAFRADAALLRANCLQFNEPASPLVSDAKAVFAALQRVADVAEAAAGKASAANASAAGGAEAGADVGADADADVDEEAGGFEGGGEK